MNDKIIANLIKKETKRQNETIDLIASENYVSKDVLVALGSVFTNKYAEGYPGKRYYAGNQYADKLENLAKFRALKCFNLSSETWRVNVQSYSGSPANFAIYLALVPLGEKIMGMSLDMGGHLTHGHKVSASGQLWQQIPYGLNRKTEMLDYSEIFRIAKKEKPQLIVTGYTAYSRIIDFQKFRQIADSVNALLMVDMSHFAGLVAGKVYPSPFSYADIVMTTMHKTLRGPRSALIFSKSIIQSPKSKVSISEAIDRAVFPGLQGGPHLNQIAATAVALKETNSPNFKKYAEQILKNAKVLSAELQKLGWRIVSDGTDTHLLLVDVAQKVVSGKVASDVLASVGIIVNKNAIPYDTRSPMDPSGIRLGSPAVTTRGMREKEMKIIASLINETLLNKKSSAVIKKSVLKLCQKFPVITIYKEMK